MATKMTINGVSTCQSAGTENYEKFQTGIGRRKRLPPHGRGTFLLCQTHIRRMSSRTGQVANGKGKEGGEAMNEAGYQTLIVKFSEPIRVASVCSGLGLVFPSVMEAAFSASVSPSCQQGMAAVSSWLLFSSPFSLP